MAAASEELSALADTLAEPGPVAASGVAQAWILLTDGTGPLYNPDSRTSLCAGAARAVRELRPWPAVTGPGRRPSSGLRSDQATVAAAWSASSSPRLASSSTTSTALRTYSVGIATRAAQ